VVTPIFIFRRIKASDKDMQFRTGISAFDELNEASGTLKEYIAQDEIKGGKYITHVLLEKQEQAKNMLLGICRFRNIQDKAEAIADLMQFGVDREIIDSFKQMMEAKHPNIIYFSRIGVKEDLQDKNVGKIINDFFEFLIKRQEKNIVVYLKIRKELGDYLGTLYETIGEGEDKKWGKYLVKIKLFL
jgi:hypothetical protein